MSNNVFPGWAGYYDSEANICNVMPTDDQVIHEYSEDCVCQPTTDVSPDGINVIFHSALDGRRSPITPRERTVYVVPVSLVAQAAAVLAGVALLVHWLRKPWRR